MKKKTLVLLVGLLATAATFAGCGSLDATSSSTELKSSAASSASSTVLTASGVGTSAQVDNIARAAREDAKSITDEKTSEAVAFIRNHYPNYFVDKETMEKTMYYGYLLEYAYEKNTSKKVYADLGQDAYQVVKYIYRGTETIDSQYTKSNLYQIEKSLNKIQ